MNGDWSPSGETYCLRCRNIPMEKCASSDTELTFFYCATCKRHYAHKPGKGLTFRWGHPISLALYSVIFDKDPVNDKKAASAAADLAKGLSVNEIEKVLYEIELELFDPMQKVRDILDCRAREEDLRAYLRLVCHHLKEYLPSAVENEPTGPESFFSRLKRLPGLLRYRN